MLNKLDECRNLLRLREISPKGRFTYPDDVEMRIKAFGEKIEKLLYELNFDELEKEGKYNNEINNFVYTLEQILRTVYKVLIRAGLECEFTEADLWSFVEELQDMMTFVLSLQTKMGKSTFEKAW